MWIQGKDLPIRYPKLSESEWGNLLFEWSKAGSVTPFRPLNPDRKADLYLLSSDPKSPSRWFRVVPPDGESAYEKLRAKYYRLEQLERNADLTDAERIGEYEDMLEGMERTGHQHRSPGVEWFIEQLPEKKKDEAAAITRLRAEIGILEKQLEPYRVWGDPRLLFSDVIALLMNSFFRSEEIERNLSHLHELPFSVTEPVLAPEWITGKQLVHEAGIPKFELLKLAHLAHASKTGTELKNGERYSPDPSNLPLVLTYSSADLSARIHYDPSQYKDESEKEKAISILMECIFRPDSLPDFLKQRLEKKKPREHESLGRVLQTEQGEGLPSEGPPSRELVGETQNLKPEKIGRAKDASWKDFTISVISDEMCRIKTPKGEEKYHYSQIGMADKRKIEKPTLLWHMMKMFAIASGCISQKTMAVYAHGRDSEKIEDIPKTAQRLDKHLQKFFGIKDSIFAERYKKHHEYRTKITFRDLRDPRAR